MVTIHWDFTDGTEISYIEGLDKEDNFTTNCLEFFDFSYTHDVTVLRKDGTKISVWNIQSHTDKEIRLAHNLRKMLVAGSFKWL